MSFAGLTYAVTIRHWFPILMFCPVNGWPDFVYVSVTFEDEFMEIYSVRKQIRKAISGKKRFMEDLAHEVSLLFPNATQVTLRLMFDRHVVIFSRPFTP